MSGGDGIIEPVRLTGFPEIKEAFLTDSLQATFILAPMAMKLREEGHGIKIVYLGHRDGTTMMVGKDSDIHEIEDLTRPHFVGGKKVKRRIAIPSRLSNQFLILFKAFRERKMEIDDVIFEDVKPPDMPLKLKQGHVDAIIAGEPLMAQTEVAGFGRVLFMTKHVWPEFISCVLAVKDSTIRTRRPEVQRLVDGIARSGMWLDQDKDEPGGHNHRMQASRFMSKHYDPELLAYVLSKPPDRVKYTNLNVRREDFDNIRKYFLLAAPYMNASDRFKGTVDFDDYCDPSFVPEGRVLEPYRWEMKK